jgi:S-(hydroxymethyl)glutathione dehydrogenase / alcohol dehydrogenase
MKFEAAVLHKVGDPLRIEQVELLGLERQDVLVRMRASGLCHTDLEVMQGTLAYPLPIVLGHEGAGIVEEVGPDVTRVKPGDHVVCSWNPHCGHCFYCERDQPILCEPFSKHQPSGFLMDGRSRYRLDGRMLHHFSTVSSHAQYCVVPESGAVAVPRDIPFDRACLIGCGVMTGVGAAVRHAKVEHGSHVLVVGCGAVGLNVLQGARLAGAETIIAVERSAGRRDICMRMGATHFLGPDVHDPLSAVRDLTSARGADYVFECAGGESALRLGLEATRPGGQLVILGKTQVDNDVRLRFGSIMGDKRIVRSSYGGARPRRDFPWLAQRYLDGQLYLDELVSLRLSLAEINLGFDAMVRGEIIRAVVEFPG